MNALEKLQLGFARFKQQYYVDSPQLYEQFIEKGQFPKTIIIACCDSRVSPTAILNTEPGEVFVVRNVANLVPPYIDDGNTHGTSAALEFAVKHLKVEHIIILGHGHCGGIKSLMNDMPNASDTDFIEPWMHIAEPAKNHVMTLHPEKSFEEQCKLCEQEAISLSMSNLMTFPFIKHAVADNILSVHGWYFDIEQGELIEQ